MIAGAFIDRNRDDVVRPPRATDAIGAALRSMFAPAAPQNEWDQLLRRLDDIPGRH